MIKTFLALSLTAFGAQATETTAAKLGEVAERQLLEDFRIVFRFENNVVICGGTGDAYVGEVEMNKPRREMTDGVMKLSDNWVPTGKSYSIFAAELGSRQASLMDPDNCME